MPDRYQRYRQMERVALREPWPVSSTITIISYGDGKPSRLNLHDAFGNLMIDEWVPRAQAAKIVQAISAYLGQRAP